MVRVKGGTVTHKRHKKVLNATKGYRGKRNSVYRLAHQAYMKAGMNAYVGRKQKKRDFRSLWIKRISNALRSNGLRYSVIKNKWLHAKMEIDRKNLSELAVNYPDVFEKIVEVAKKTERITV